MTTEPPFDTWTHRVRHDDGPTTVLHVTGWPHVELTVTDDADVLAQLRAAADPLADDLHLGRMIAALHIAAPAALLDPADADETAILACPCSGCHCLCGVAHPDEIGVCTGRAETTVRVVSYLAGEHDMSTCQPCRDVLLGVRS
jgi:hypothetical protein